MSTQVGETVQNTIQNPSEAAGRLADQARGQITSQLTTQKDRATGTLSALADALHQTGNSLRESDQAPVAGIADRAADGIERISSYMQQRDVRALRYDAERLARQQPVVFLAGAFAIGWFGARFLKSDPSQANDSWQQGTGPSDYSGWNREYQSTAGAPYAGSAYGTEMAGRSTAVGQTGSAAGSAQTPSM